MNSEDLARETYSLVKKALPLSSAIKSPENNVKNACANATIPGAKYFISNCGDAPWKMT